MKRVDFLCYFFFDFNASLHCGMFNEILMRLWIKNFIHVFNDKKKKNTRKKKNANADIYT